MIFGRWIIPGMIWLALLLACIVGIWLIYVAFCVGVKMIAAIFLIIIHKIQTNLRKMDRLALP